jgi:hypothetical protein
MAWLKRIVIGVVALIVLAGAGLEIYSRVPADFAVPPLAAPAGATSLVILFHGSGGRDEPTLIAVTQRFEQLAALVPGTAVIRYVWSPWSDNRFRSRVNGLHVGAELGREVAALTGLRYIHLVGHSAGAYPLEAFCRAYRAAAKAPARIEMTYLDPIGFSGAFDPGWGVRNHGACADYAEAFINTDDPVPATNAALSQAWNVDVTGAAGRSGGPEGGHVWPVRYYLGQLGPADLEPGAHEQASRPRGAVERR